MFRFDPPPRKPRPLTRAEEHLDRFVGDPLYMDFRDEDFIQHTTQQFRRVYGDAPHVPGNLHREPGDGVIGNDIEGYRPRDLFVSELDLSGSVGDGGRNRGKDVVAAKKALARLGAFDFDLRDGKSTEATPRFLESLRTTQQALGEKPDGRADPRGPTIAALRDAVFDAAGYERDTPDRDLAPKLARAKRELAQRAQAAAETGRKDMAGKNLAEKSVSQSDGDRKPDTPRPQDDDRKDARGEGAGEPTKEDVGEGDEAGRNPILEETGFTFAKDSGSRVGGRWLRPDGEPASPGELRDVVTETIRRRAEREGWSAGRTLAELHEARSGLPFDDRNNIEVAVWFLPLLPAAAGAASAAGTAAGAAGAGWLNAFLAGLGLSAILSLSGDTPRDKTEDDEKSVPVPRAEEQGREDDREEVTVYRVEGNENMRILIDRSGGVTIVRPDGEMLHLNFGQRQRALEFLEKKITKGLPTDPVIKSFDVPKAFLEKLRAASIRQRRATEKDPDRIFPRRVDENLAIDQFELPNNWIKELQRQIIQGTRRIEKPKGSGIRPQK